MGINVRIVVAIGIIAYFLIITVMVRKEMISLRYALIWYCWGALLAVFDAFPPIIVLLAKVMYIETPINALMLICIFLIFVTLIIISGLYSRQGEKIKRLTQENALLEKRVRDMENGKNESTE